MNNKIFKKVRLPDKPGVYFFKKGKDVIYIGKATSLKDRVRSYFGKDLIQTRGPILVEMVFNTDKIDYEVTDSVLEALILEANLIKKYQPKYNTKEKSDKSFNYVCITKELLPKILIVRGRNVKHSVFNKIERSSIFGPFPNSTQLREALKIIRRIFPFLDDKSKNYLEFYKQINLIPDLNDKTLYLYNIKNIKLFFEGKKKRILQNLKKEMKEYAGKREFEKAGEIKRQIFALQHINDVSLLKNNGVAGNEIFVSEGPTLYPLMCPKKGAGLKISLPAKPFRIEAYDIAHMGGKNMVGAMVVLEDGEVVKSEYKRFKIRTQTDANDTGALKEMLERRFGHTEWPYPELIVVDGGIAQINATKAILVKMGLKINIVSVVKDERHKPKAILFPSRSDLKGTQGPTLIKKYKREILLANNEAHRFAIAYHKNMRDKNFLK